MADNTVNINTQNDTVTVEKDASANSVSVTNSNTTVNVTAPSNTVTLDGATSANTVTINSQNDIIKLLSITEPKGDTVTITEPESKVVTVTTPGPPGSVLASASETDSAITFNRDIKLDAGEHIHLIEDQRIYFEEDNATWIESNTADRLRIIAGGQTMLTLDQASSKKRAVFGYETKVYIGANNNATPDKELEVDGDMLIGDYIKHMGDEDTYIRFQTNNLNLVSGGNSFIKCDKSTNKIQINNGNADLDMQVMGDDGSTILHTDAGTNRVGILETSPSYTLDVDGDIRVTGGLVVDSNYDNSSIHATNILLTNAVKYTDSGGDNRYALHFDSDVVALSNRTSNGKVQIRANSSTAGSGGEVTSSIFTNYSNEFLQPVTASGNISSSGNIYAADYIGPVNDDLDIRSDKNINLYLDDDDDGTFHKFQLYEDGNVFFAVAEDGKAAIGTAVTSTSLDGLTVVGGITATGNVTASGEISASGAISFDGSATFGAAGVGGTTYTFTNASSTSVGSDSLGFIIAAGSTIDHQVMKISGSAENASVGIGTPYLETLTKALTVNGEVSASGAVTASNLQINGAQVDFTNLPTSDPGVAGRLWNDSNTLKISAG